MPRVARLNDPISHGGKIITASGDSMTDGLGTARVGDMVDCKKHGPNRIVGGGPGTTDNKKTARVGDKTECGATITEGSGQREMGDSEAGADGGNVQPPPSQAFTKPADKPMTVANPAKVRDNNVGSVAYVNNPGKFNNPVAAENGVKQNYNPPPEDSGLVDPEPPKKCSNGHDATVIPFLQKILAEAAKGMWRESGQGGRPSNQNILGIWKSLGFPASGMFLTDQTAWCAGFVNVALKESGLPYLKETGAVNCINKGGSIGWVKVDIASMQPGDVVLWSFHHVNFCYTASGGKYTFVGGNQTPKGTGKNNPDDGDVTISWPGGWTPSRGGIVAVMRPACK